MKSACVVLTLLALAAPLAASPEAPNPADYTEILHVTTSELELHGTNRPDQVLWVTTGGKRYELLAPAILAEGRIIGFYSGLLPIGDYKARRIPDTKDKPGYLIFDSYELLLPDGKTARFAIIGETEAAS